MLYSLLEHYFLPGNLPWYSPIMVAALVAGDYHLYLYEHSESNWFVVVEVDYPSVLDIQKDIESSFPVKVVGWRVLLDQKSNTANEVLPPNIFKNENINESDDDWGNYKKVAYKKYGLTYMVLEVKPDEDVTAKDLRFGHYKNA